MTSNTPKKHRKWPWVAGSIAVLAVVGAVAANSGSSTPDTASTHGQTTVTTTAKATTPAGPANVITEDGTYVVGKDIEAGTWHTDGRSSLGLCYWERDRNLDGDLGSIIANDDLTGGPATVTVHSSDKAFKVTGGCTWTRQ